MLFHMNYLVMLPSYLRERLSVKIPENSSIRHARLEFALIFRERPPSLCFSGILKQGIWSSAMAKCCHLSRQHLEGTTKQNRLGVGGHPLEASLHELPKPRPRPTTSLWTGLAKK